MNQKDLAKVMTVAQSYISQVENGKTIPTPMFIKLFCLQFSINDNYLKNNSGVTKCSVGVQTGVKADGTPAMQNVDMLLSTFLYYLLDNANYSVEDCLIYTKLWAQKVNREVYDDFLKVESILDS